MCSSVHVEINRLLEENKKPKAKLSGKQMNAQFFTHDSKVKYYTGLPSFALLMSLL